MARYHGLPLFDPGVETPCQADGVDRDAWFPDKDKTAAAARRLCSGCPVIEACGEHGRRYGEWGVWGGVYLGWHKP
jgi:hypothetical protein